MPSRSFVGPRFYISKPCKLIRGGSSPGNRNETNTQRNRTKFQNDVLNDTGLVAWKPIPPCPLTTATTAATTTCPTALPSFADPPPPPPRLSLRRSCTCIPIPMNHMPPAYAASVSGAPLLLPGRTSRVRSREPGQATPSWRPRAEGCAATRQRAPPSTRPALLRGLLFPDCGRTAHSQPDKPDQSQRLPTSPARTQAARLALVQRWSVRGGPAVHGRHSTTRGFTAGSMGQLRRRCQGVWFRHAAAAQGQGLQGEPSEPSAVTAAACGRGWSSARLGAASGSYSRLALARLASAGRNGIVQLTFARQQRGRNCTSRILETSFLQKKSSPRSWATTLCNKSTWHEASVTSVLKKSTS